ncbi:MAG: hypothetical protein HOO96_17240 [Polyangiaceae bacterium]|nr:hypothetical protein [Polyangiaceae bacterium]
MAPVVIPKLAVGPKGSTNPRDWLVRAGLLALTNTSGLEGANSALLAARDLVKVGAAKDAAALARAAAALARGQRKRPGVSDDMVVKCLAGCVECVGHAGEARTLLDEACVLREGLDPFWKKHTANDLTDAARAAGALDVLRRRKVPISKRLPPAKSARPRSHLAILRDVANYLASEDGANAHATFASLLGCGKELHARNDLRSLAKLTTAADEKANTLKLAKGWVASAALSSLAVLHFLLDDEGGMQRLLGLAERAAAAERTASSKETCALSLRSAFDEVGQADRAFTTFRGPPDPFREVASAVRRGAVLEVERRVAAEKDLDLKSRLLRHVATVLGA